MLKSLSISNFAVILSAQVDFGSGLNILTGETGAGKSIIIDAINVILGNRVSKNIIRSGMEKARAEALFEVDESVKNILEEFGIECEDNELLISREVNTDGYNGRLLYALETPSPMFSDIGECVLDDTGECLIYIDDIFSETVNTNIEYQVFLQQEGQGDCWVEDKQKLYFIIKGTPNLCVAWEVKAIQRNYEYQRLEETDGLYNTIDRDMMDNLIESISLYDEDFASIIEEGEELLDETA